MHHAMGRAGMGLIPSFKDVTHCRSPLIPEGARQPDTQIFAGHCDVGVKSLSAIKEGSKAAA